MVTGTFHYAVNTTITETGDYSFNGTAICNSLTGVSQSGIPYGGSVYVRLNQKSRVSNNQQVYFYSETYSLKGNDGSTLKLNITWKLVINAHGDTVIDVSSYSASCS